MQEEIYFTYPCKKNDGVRNLLQVHEQDIETTACDVHSVCTKVLSQLSNKKQNKFLLRMIKQRSLTATKLNFLKTFQTEPLIYTTKVSSSLEKIKYF